MKFVRLTVKILLPVLVLVGFALAARSIVNNKPQAERRKPPPSTGIAVQALRPVAQDYRVTLRSQGTISAATSGTLISQLGGTLTEVSESLREGGFFERGELLVQIDRRDYDIAVTIAEAELARTQASLEEEKARAVLAKQEQKLARRKNANPLALRRPQLAAAQAGVAAAEAQLARARLNLQRTQIVAPYRGRVMQKNVDIGQYVTPGTVLASVYATDHLQVRLPLSGRQLDYLELPDMRSTTAEGKDTDQDQDQVLRFPSITLRAVLGRSEHRWPARLVRSEGVIDTQSRQLFVIAQIDDPYADSGDDPDRPPLRIGQFVTAEIQGVLLSDVLVVPRRALAEGDEALLIDADSRLLRRQVEVLWSSQNDVILAESLAPETLLSLTPLPGVLSGSKVSATVVDGDERLAQRKPE